MIVARHTTLEIYNMLMRQIVAGYIPYYSLSCVIYLHEALACEPLSAGRALPPPGGIVAGAGPIISGSGSAGCGRARPRYRPGHGEHILTDPVQGRVQPALPGAGLSSRLPAPLAFLLIVENFH